MDDDLKTIQAIGTGDEAALAELMDRYREPIFRLAYRYVGNPTDAASLTEETFVKVYFNARKYRARASVKSWIFAIAGNLCRDFLRRERRSRKSVSLSTVIEGHDESITLGDTISDVESNTADSMEGKEQLAEIHAAIQDLPEKLRFPFIFCVLEGHSHKDAAAVLKTTRKTVESRVYRARHELQTRLQS